MYSNNDEKYGPRLGWFGSATGETDQFISLAQQNPWLQVHINHTNVVGIVVGNRKDGAHERFTNIEVRAGLKEDPLANDVVGRFDGPGVLGGEHHIEFSKVVLTEYFTIQLKRQDYLQINGIKVVRAGM